MKPRDRTPGAPSLLLVQRQLLPSQLLTLVAASDILSMMEYGKNLHGNAICRRVFRWHCNDYALSFSVCSSYLMLFSLQVPGEKDELKAPMPMFPTKTAIELFKEVVSRS